MLLGYNTNGLAHHDPLDALALLSETGYRSVALTLDHGLLNPFGPDLPVQVERVRKALDDYGMRSVVETGARFLLDWRVKHEPTLMSADAAGRRRRVDFLCRAVDIAAELGSDCVSFWSGILHDEADREEAWQRLTDGLREVIDHAEKRDVVLGFEPEPGMFIDTMDAFRELLGRIDAPQLMLTLDVGHLHCLGETPVAGQIELWAERIINVHIEDMRRGEHRHLMFGEGEMDFPPIIDALARVGYRGGLHVELSRHSHEGPQAVRHAYEFLNPLVQAAGKS